MINELISLKESYKTALNNSDYRNFIEAFVSFFNNFSFINFLLLLLMSCTFFIAFRSFYRTFFEGKLVVFKHKFYQHKLSKINDILDNCILEGSLSMDINKKSISRKKLNSLKSKRDTLSSKISYLNCSIDNFHGYVDTLDKVFSIIMVVVSFIVFYLGVNVSYKYEIKNDIRDKYEAKSMEVYNEFNKNSIKNQMEVLRLKKISSNEYQLIYVNGEGVISEISYRGKLEIDNSLDNIVYEFNYLPLKESYENTLLKDKELTYGRSDEVIKIGKNNAYVLDGTSEYISNTIIK